MRPYTQRIAPRSSDAIGRMMRPMDLPLASWLKTILEIVNAPRESNVGATRLRKQLKGLIDGTLPLRRHFMHPLPPLFVSLRGGHPRLVADLRASMDAEEDEPADFLEWATTRYASELEGVIYAL